MKTTVTVQLTVSDSAEWSCDGERQLREEVVHALDQFRQQGVVFCYNVMDEVMIDSVVEINP